MSRFWVGGNSGPGLYRTTGEDWAIWRQQAIFDDSLSTLRNWVIGDVFNIQYPVKHGGVYYRCIVSHTSWADSEPGVGSVWATYWEIVPAGFVEAYDFWWDYIPADKTITIEKAVGWFEVGNNPIGSGWTVTLYANGVPTDVVFTFTGTGASGDYAYVETTGSFSFTEPTSFYWIIESPAPVVPLVAGQSETLADIQFLVYIAGYDKKLAIYQRDLSDFDTYEAASQIGSIIGQYNPEYQAHPEYAVQNALNVKAWQVNTSPQSLYATPPTSLDIDFSINKNGTPTAFSVAAIDASIGYQLIRMTDDVAFAPTDEIALGIDWTGNTALDPTNLRSIITVEYQDAYTQDIICGNIGVDVANNEYEEFAQLVPYPIGDVNWIDPNSLTFYPLEVSPANRYAAPADATANSLTIYYTDFNAYANDYDIDLTFYVNGVATSLVVHLVAGVDPTTGIKSNTSETITINEGDLLFFRATSPDAPDNDYATVFIDWLVLGVVDAPDGPVNPPVESSGRYILFCT